MKIAWKRGKPYIVPTLYGIAYFFLILNIFALGYYRNSAPFHTVALTLSILGLVAMIQTNSSTRGLACQLETIEAGAARGQSKLKLRLSSSKPEGHFNLEIEPEKKWQSELHCSVDFFCEQQSVSLDLQCGERGIYALEAIKIASRGLFGLFYTWTWLGLETEWVVYPQPEGSLPLPESSEGEVDGQQLGDEFHGHRPHQPGTPLRHIDWKAFARSEKLLIKDFQQQDEGAVRLSLTQLPAMEREAQLQQLCAWVFLCTEQNRAFSLDLEQSLLPSGHGSEHLKLALRALAGYREGV